MEHIVYLANSVGFEAPLWSFDVHSAALSLLGMSTDGNHGPLLQMAAVPLFSWMMFEGVQNSLASFRVSAQQNTSLFSASMSEPECTQAITLSNETGAKHQRTLEASRLMCFSKAGRASSTSLCQVPFGRPSAQLTGDPEDRETVREWETSQLTGFAKVCMEF